MIFLIFSWQVREHEKKNWGFAATNRHHSYNSSSRPTRYHKLYIFDIINVLVLRSGPLQCLLTGFISLDCGLPSTEASPYEESYTKLLFSSDQTFIRSGGNGRIAKNPEGFAKPYTTLRYFPEGKRNCYSLKVEKGRMYMIVARFVYGNYDGFDLKPKFDLYLGPNLWTTIDLQRLGTDSTSEEILHMPTSDSLQICLVKTGETTPFISALEIRALGNDSYITKSGSMRRLSRTYFSKSGSNIR